MAQYKIASMSHKRRQDSHSSNAIGLAIVCKIVHTRVARATKSPKHRHHSLTIVILHFDLAADAIAVRRVHRALGEARALAAATATLAALLALVALAVEHGTHVGLVGERQVFATCTVRGKLITIAVC